MKNRSAITRWGQAIAVNSVLLILLLLFTMPFILMGTGTFKDRHEILSRHMTILPQQWVWENYSAVFNQVPYLRWYGNTIFVAISRTGLSLFLCSLAGYAFAKYDFKGKQIMFFFLLVTMMLPFQIQLVPLFIMVVRLNLIDNYAALIIPFAASAFGIFLMRQYMLDIPDELLDAARIDGTSEFGIYWRVVLPVSKPALGLMGILFFNWNWNDFLWPLIVLKSDSMLTLNIGIQRLLGQYSDQYGVLLAAAFLAILPVIIVFLLMQRQFMTGLMAGAVKGGA